MEYSLSANSSYYRSKCTHCGTAQGDNYIISEYNAPFYPIDINHYDKIKFNKIMQEIRIFAGSYSIGYGIDKINDNVDRHHTPHQKTG